MSERAEPARVTDHSRIDPDARYIMCAIASSIDGSTYLYSPRIVRGWEFERTLPDCYAALLMPEWLGIPGSGREVVASDATADKATAADVSEQVRDGAASLLSVCEEIAATRIDLLDSELRIRLYSAITRAGGSLWRQP